jgi:hypothetical protein
MFIKKLVIGLLSFFAFEFKRNDHKSYESFCSDIKIERTYEARRRQLKKREKRYKNSKWRKRKTYATKAYKFQGSNPKDARFFNQRMLRRMFRNC